MLTFCTLRCLWIVDIRTLFAGQTSDGLSTEFLWSVKSDKVQARNPREFEDDDIQDRSVRAGANNQLQWFSSDHWSCLQWLSLAAAWASTRATDLWVLSREIPSPRLLVPLQQSLQDFLPRRHFQTDTPAPSTHSRSADHGPSTVCAHPFDRVGRHRISCCCRLGHVQRHCDTARRHELAFERHPEGEVRLAGAARGEAQGLAPDACQEELPSMI